MNYLLVSLIILLRDRTARAYTRSFLSCLLTDAFLCGTKEMQGITCTPACNASNESKHIAVKVDPPVQTRCDELRKEGVERNVHHCIAVDASDAMENRPHAHVVEIGRFVL